MIATKEQLKKMQEKEILMFRSFVDICEKLDLRYYIIGGTLLGAVRHGGFIPWDDDIDVGMPRCDYEIFMKEAGKYLPKGMFLQNCHTETEYYSNTGKIRDCNTTYIESALKNKCINHGIFIDIFPLDNYPARNLSRMWLMIRKKIISARISKAYIEKKGIKLKELIRGLLSIVYPTVHQAVESRERLYKSVPESGLLANHSGMWGEKEIIPAEWYAEGCLLSFEGMTVKGPKEYKKWLTQVYGDYMKLPPAEKRVTHHEVEVIDLERPYTDYFGKNE